MATLQSTNITGTLTSGGSTVWHAGNDGAGTSLNVNAIWGYDARYLNILRRSTFLDLTAGVTTKYYPLTYSGARWGSGVSAIAVHRGNVHQDGSGYGSLFGRIRYRSTAWGHHRSFWEVTDNWGYAGFYPFIGGATNTSQTSQAAIWLKGGLTYYYRFDSDEVFDSVNVQDTKPFPESNNPSATISFIESPIIPSESRYYDQHICGKSGFSLGQSSFRWNTVFATAENASSDGRKKENIIPSFGTEFLKLLQPKSYTRKDRPENQKRSHGMVAQEVEGALQQLNIPADDFGGLDDTNKNDYGLRYAEFIPVLVKTLKEKRAKVNLLKSRIEALEARL
jgi:hypothetical protein